MQHTVVCLFPHSCSDTSTKYKGHKRTFIKRGFEQRRKVFQDKAVMSAQQSYGLVKH